MKKLIITSGILFIALFVLVCCKTSYANDLIPLVNVATTISTGGGGGGGSVSIQLPSQQNVSINKPWTIKFNKELDSNSITNANIYVNDDSTAITVNLDPNDSKNVIVNPPSGGWDSNSTNYLYVTKGVRSKDGQYLKSVFSMCFTTQEVLPAPTGLRAVTERCSQVDIYWDKVEGATSYKIFMSTDHNGTFSNVKTILNPGTSYVLEGLLPSTTYWFKIKAVGVSEGEFSSAVSATTFAPPDQLTLGQTRTRIIGSWVRGIVETYYSSGLRKTEWGFSSPSYTNYSIINPNKISIHYDYSTYTYDLEFYGNDLMYMGGGLLTRMK